MIFERERSNCLQPLHRQKTTATNIALGRAIRKQMPANTPGLGVDVLEQIRIQAKRRKVDYQRRGQVGNQTASARASPPGQSQQHRSPDRSGAEHRLGHRWLPRGQVGQRQGQEIPTAARANVFGLNGGGGWKNGGTLVIAGPTSTGSQRVVQRNQLLVVLIGRSGSLTSILQRNQRRRFGTQIHHQLVLLPRGWTPCTSQTNPSGSTDSLPAQVGQCGWC